MQRATSFHATGRGHAWSIFSVLLDRNAFSSVKARRNAPLSGLGRVTSGPLRKRATGASQDLRVDLAIVLDPAGAGGVGRIAAAEE
jgi:hypothetical protein